jgi:hypothetical protein
VTSAPTTAAPATCSQKSSGSQSGSQVTYAPTTTTAATYAPTTAAPSTCSQQQSSGSQSGSQVTYAPTTTAAATYAPTTAAPSTCSQQQSSGSQSGSQVTYAPTTTAATYAPTTAAPATCSQSSLSSNLCSHSSCFFRISSNIHDRSPCYLLTKFWLACCFIWISSNLCPYNNRCFLCCSHNKGP